MDPMGLETFSSQEPKKVNTNKNQVQWCSKAMENEICSGSMWRFFLKTHMVDDDAFMELEAIFWVISRFVSNNKFIYGEFSRCPPPPGNLTDFPLIIIDIYRHMSWLSWYFGVCLFLLFALFCFCLFVCLFVCFSHFLYGDYNNPSEPASILERHMPPKFNMELEHDVFKSRNLQWYPFHTIPRPPSRHKALFSGFLNHSVSPISSIFLGKVGLIGLRGWELTRSSW